MIYLYGVSKNWEADGDWKIALDKTIEEMFKKLGTP